MSGGEATLQILHSDVVVPEHFLCGYHDCFGLAVRKGCPGKVPRDDQSWDLAVVCSQHLIAHDRGLEIWAAVDWAGSLAYHVDRLALYPWVYHFVGLLVVAGHLQHAHAESCKTLEDFVMI